MFSSTIARSIIKAAEANSIDPAGLLAIVEIETGGKTFEADGRTPRLLYERHIAYREAKKRGCLNKFTMAGLAIPHWNRATQYKDQGSSARRLDILRRARAINEEVALRSCSFGIGQTMGFLAEGIGFSDASEMYSHMQGSLNGQIDCMIRELKRSNIVGPLNAHEWRTVARLYNGPGYAKNSYDTRLRDAHARWKRKLLQLSAPPPPEEGLDQDEIKDIQRKLRDLGFHEIGDIDGLWGSKTTGALSAFQHHSGLSVTGHYDEATRAALQNSDVARPADQERDLTTADDLREKGSKTIKHADGLSKLGTIGKWLSGLFGGGVVAEQGGLLDGNVQSKLDQAQATIEQAKQAKGLWNTVHGWITPIFNDPLMLFLCIALFVAFWVVGCIAKRIIDNRVADHRSGVHAGPEA